MEVIIRMKNARFVAALLMVPVLLVGSHHAPAAAADIGPKPSVDVTVGLNGAPVPEEPFYAQMLTCQAPDAQMTPRCGFDGAACDKFLTLAEPEPAAACTWRLHGLPTVWGGECVDSQCHFTYFLPTEFRLAVYLPGLDQLFVSNAVTRDTLYAAYRLELAENGSARLVENTPLLLRPHVRGVLLGIMFSLGIELAVGYVFVRLTRSPPRALWGVVIGNLLTVPLLYLFEMTVGFHTASPLLVLVLAELGVVVGVGRHTRLGLSPYSGTDWTVVLEHVAQSVTRYGIGETQLLVTNHSLRRQAVEIVLGGEEPGADHVIQRGAFRFDADAFRLGQPLRADVAQVPDQIAVQCCFCH